MPQFDDRIALAEHHVRRGREIVARQRELIAELRARTHDTARSEQLLDNFEQSLRAFECDLARLIQASEAHARKDAIVLAESRSLLVKIDEESRKDQRAQLIPETITIRSDDKASEYRKQAAACRAMAERLSLKADKTRMLEMAEHWLDLARRAEAETDHAGGG